MSEIGLFIKLSDSVEFLCIRAYQPPTIQGSDCWSLQLRAWNTKRPRQRINQRINL